MPHPEKFLMKDHHVIRSSDSGPHLLTFSDKTDGFDIPNQYYNEGDHNFDTVVLHQPTNMCTGRAKDRSPTMTHSKRSNFFRKRPFWHRSSLIFQIRKLNQASFLHRISVTKFRNSKPREKLYADRWWKSGAKL